MNNKPQSSPKNTVPYLRQDVADNLYEYEQILSKQKSQRQASEELKIPRSTLRDWKSRKDNIPFDPSIVECLESPAGTHFLHTLVTAIQFVMNELGG